MESRRCGRSSQLNSLCFTRLACGVEHQTQIKERDGATEPRSALAAALSHLDRECGWSGLACSCVCFVTLLCTERQTFFLVPALTLKGAKSILRLSLTRQPTATERSGNESGVLREHFGWFPVVGGGGGDGGGGGGVGCGVGPTALYPDVRHAG